MTDHIEAIRKALEAGPTMVEWEFGPGGPTWTLEQGGRLAASVVHPDNRSYPIMRVGAPQYDNRDEVVANAKLVTACNPVAMTAVLAELDRLNRESACATAEKNGLLEILKNHTGFDHGVMAIRSLVERAEKAADAALISSTLR